MKRQNLNQFSVFLKVFDNKEVRLNFGERKMENLIV
tara:strand:- start:187 stop:294 length:108 start_codon:yes stop_codon:yes gene_type:complete